LFFRDWLPQNHKFQVRKDGMYFQIKEHNLGQTLDKNNNNKNVENNFIALFSNVVYFFQMKLSYQDSGKF